MTPPPKKSAAPPPADARVLLSEWNAGVPRLALRKLEAAAAIGLSDESFDRYVKPSVRCVRVGALRLYAIADLQRWLDENASAPLDGFEERAA